MFNEGGGILLIYYEIFVDLRKLRNYMEKLSKQEEDAMQAVWKTGEGNIKLFLDNMEGAAVMPYTTLASTIKNLEKKGYLSSRLIGNAYLYKPVITEDAYKQQFMSGFVKDYFDNSYKELVNFFVEEKKLSAQELKETIALIERSGR
jgi:BlaI family transcriptional regulator, penicillinase repressor